MSLVRHQFGPEGPAYVRAQLEFAWKPLAGMLLAHDIDAGSAWASVPEEWSTQRRGQFELGTLVFSSDGPNTEPVEAWARERAAALGEGGLIVAEHPYAEPSDGFLTTDSDPVFFVGDAVYDFAAADAADDHLSRVLSPDYPSIAVVTDAGALDAAKLDRRIVAMEDLEAMAAAAQAIIVGAWDAVGLVVWEPK